MSNPRRTLASGLASSSTPVPEFETLAPERIPVPVARVSSQIRMVHGETRVDNYDWLRNRSDPEVLAYLEAENRYADAIMHHTLGLQEQLYQEMRGRIQETDLSVPEQRDEYSYYHRIEAGVQYPVFCRRRVSSDGPEEIILDQNGLAAGYGYFRLGAVEVSPDHHLLAYTVDTSGAEEFTLFIRDLDTGTVMSESIAGVSSRPAWASDSRTLFYCVLDETRRPYRLYRHAVGTSRNEDVLVYVEPDASFYMDVSRTRSGKYLLLDLSSHTTSEVWFTPADQPNEPFKLIQPRQTGVEYTVTHHENSFFITTNDSAPNFRLVQAPTGHPSREHWSPVLPYRPDVKLDSTDAFRRHLVVYEREAGLRRLRIIDFASGAEHLIPFPEPVYTVRPHTNPDFESATLRFTYTSLVTPSSVVDYDMEQHTWTVRKLTQVRGGYDASQYRSERLLATAPDGAKVPISLVYRLPLTPDTPRPLLLSGYGAYGLTYDPAFSSNTLSLLDRGVVVAIAHVRGGEELGRAWYEGGRRLEKRSSFTDFIACAEHLIAAGYTAADRLVISGGSAGGLLIGAVTNFRPDLFLAALAEVPFVDVINTMLDASLPLTVIEYDEWGNPSDPEAYAYIRSYSPYDNVEAKDYPHLLITAGLNDPRVAYWEPAKWAAKLRATKTDQNRLLLRTNMDAGHGGASGRYDFLRETAFKYAFILDVLGEDSGIAQPL
jgi:oligopeptidase B